MDLKQKLVDLAVEIDRVEHDAAVAESHARLESAEADAAGTAPA